MSNEIKVTVYLSTYNQQEYVAQALDSILMQKTNFPFEIIAADDCSTDDTQKIILDYQKRYPYMIETYFTNPNVGGCRKLTNCIDLGLFRGEYLAYLEGDDYWLGEDRLQTLVDFLDSNPEYSRIAHQRNVIDQHGNYLYPDIPLEYLDKTFTIEDFLAGRDYSDFGSVFRNYFKEAGNKYHELFWASKNVCDFQDMFITQDYGPVYLTSKCFGAYRLQNSPNASNYNSITTNQYRRIDQISICRAIERFYGSIYDLTLCIESNLHRMIDEAVKQQDAGAFSTATEYCNGFNLLHILPSVVYDLLRSHDKNALCFLTKQIGKNNMVRVAPSVFVHSIKRIITKVSGHKKATLIRGFVRK